MPKQLGLGWAIHPTLHQTNRKSNHAQGNPPTNPLHCKQPRQKIAGGQGF